MFLMFIVKRPVENSGNCRINRIITEQAVELILNDSENELEYDYSDKDIKRESDDH
uniref:Uncharacterized protein n=1 Tax=Arion vulgaris TaxID=1028688 RepID=A0A0B7B3E4_9EUPU